MSTTLVFISFEQRQCCSCISIFLLCKGRHDTPHVQEVRALELRFHTVPLVPIGIPDGLLEVISGLLVGHWMTRVAGRRAFSQYDSNLPIAPELLTGKHRGRGLWHDLICALTDVADDRICTEVTSPSAASENISQSVSPPIAG